MGIPHFSWSQGQANTELSSTAISAKLTHQTVESLIEQVSNESGVPVFILNTIAEVESGHKYKRGPLSPWPWSINVRGQSYRFDNRSAALHFAADLLHQGETSFDGGLMQINWKAHGPSVGTLERLFDPLTNLRYAALLLLKHKLATGCWAKAMVQYHSRTPKFALVYVRKLQRQLQKNSEQKNTSTPVQHHLADYVPVHLQPVTANASLTDTHSLSSPL